MSIDSRPVERHVLATDTMPAIDEFTASENRAWKKLKNNKSALFGFVVVLFFITLAGRGTAAAYG